VEEYKRYIIGSREDVVSIYPDIDKMDDYYVRPLLSCICTELMYQVKRPSYRYGRSYINHNPQTTDLNFSPYFLPLHPPRTPNRRIASLIKED
jgi:hypothetical protein